MFNRKIVYFFVLIASLAIKVAYAQIPSCSAASKFYGKDSINITTFGASTVQGVGGFSFQGYLQQNFEFCYTNKIVSVTNYGIAGQTTSQGVPRFENAIAGRTGFVCILMGVNDALAMIGPGINLTTAQANERIKQTETNMQDMIGMAVKNNMIPVIGTIQFINDTHNSSYKTANLYIKQINAGYKKLAVQNNIYLADINAALGRDFQLYQDDFHPNDKGYKLISYVWFDAINQAIENKLLSVGLNQNYPNPANSSTKIGFSLSRSGQVAILLYSINGSQITTIANDFYNSGYHEINFNTSNLSSGVYIYTMQIAGRQLSKKMLVVR